MSQLICEEIILDCALVDIWDRGYSKIDLDNFLINIEYELYLKDWKTRQNHIKKDSYINKNDFVLAIIVYNVPWVKFCV